MSAALIAGAVSGSAHGQSTDQPDILFISLDDLNDWVSPLQGHPQVQTPNLARLAEMGIAFTNAHANAVVCNPSRTSVMSGLLPLTSGVYLNTDWRTLPRFDGVKTLPRFFRDNGYSTFGAGKVFHAVTTRAPMYFGFNDPVAWDAFYPSIERQLPDEITPHDRPANGSPFDPAFDWAPVSADDRALADGQIVAWSVDQIIAPRDGPRFQAVGIYRPHFPWYVPQRYFDLYPLEDIQLPVVAEDDLDDISDYAISQGGRVIIPPVRAFDWLLETGQWRDMVQAYLASITFADVMLGKVLDALEESGRANNTIIVVWSDHGIHMGEKGRVNKPALWHESTRVPLLIVAPGVTSPGTTSGAAVSLVDLYPTLVELVGLEPPEQAMDGTSLVPLLLDPSAEWSHPVYTSQGFENTAVLYGRYRYIRYVDGSEELYDMVEDPHEWVNLAYKDDMAEVKAQMVSLLPSSPAPDVRSMTP